MAKQTLITTLFLLSLLSLLAPCSALEGIVELSDANFDEVVKQDGSIWLVLFAADWCGHCQHLKPELEALAPRLEKLGVKIGHVNEKGNNKLINDYVVDHNTHMVSYPKLKIFLGEEVLAEVPSGLRNANNLYDWIKREYQLEEIVEGEQQETQEVQQEEEKVEEL